MGIQIKEPCNEDWSKMTPTEKGAFCKKCAIEVFDFTDKTPIQIKSILVEQMSHSGTTCGKITNAQMNSINYDFFEWKNDQESFRAIWMVSLIAVFGFTLFSCQNTISKEIVSQIESNGTEILQLEKQHESEHAALDTSINEETASVDIDSTSINVVKGWEWPGPEIVVGGAVYPWDPPIWDITELTTCVMYLGDINVTTGVVSVSPEYPKSISDVFPASVAVQQRSSHGIEYRNPQPTSQQLNGILGSGKQGFDAYLTPNPIKASSRLFLMMYECGEIKITINDIETDELIHSGSRSFVEGSHEVDLELYKVKKGKYEMTIALNDTSKFIKFVVI